MSRTALGRLPAWQRRSLPPLPTARGAHHRRGLPLRAALSTTAEGPDAGASPSLFSIPGLRAPADFARAAGRAMEDCDRLRARLAADAASTPSDEGARLGLPRARRTLYELDQISRLVCNVIDAAELCRSVHADAAWRDAAQRAFDQLAQYIAELNGDADLYGALVRVTANTALTAQLTEEERRFARLLQAEFERDGIQLPPTQRREVVQLAHSVSQLEGLFSQNIVHSDTAFRVDAGPVQDLLPDHVMRAYGIQEVATPVAAHPPQVELHTSQTSLLQSLLRYSSDPKLRREVYLAHSSSVPENLPVLDALVERRRQLAAALGFESYAHRVLQDKMARHPRHVQTFLQQLQQNTRPAWKRDMEMVAQAKRAVEGSAQVEPWDVSYYVGLLKARNGFDANNAISPYLTLEGCLGAMQTLCRRLFGIHMVEQTMSPEESWDDQPVDSTKRIRKFIYHDDNTGDALGTMYLDLHPRPAKYNHAAHFTVRCGCLATEPDQEPPQYQLPIVALVCNLSSSNEENVLSHSEVETLFHEFGHALHSLLSRTKFQHMSGTRAAMDFVETPSHLMENFVWDAQFLKILAVHPTTGEPLSDATIAKLQQSRHEFASLERQNQIIYALFDQILFGPETETTRALNTTQLFAKLHADLGVPHAPNTHWHTRFGHLVTYGAGYYGYLYSQVFAGDIWQECFQADSLSREAGRAYWHKLLIHGGAKDPAHILTDLLGRPPKASFFNQATMGASS